MKIKPEIIRVSKANNVLLSKVNPLYSIAVRREDDMSLAFFDSEQEAYDYFYTITKETPD